MYRPTSLVLRFLNSWGHHATIKLRMTQRTPCWNIHLKWIKQHLNTRWSWQARDSILTLPLSQLWVGTEPRVRWRKTIIMWAHPSVKSRVAPVFSASFFFPFVFSFVLFLAVRFSLMVWCGGAYICIHIHIIGRERMYMYRCLPILEPTSTSREMLNILMIYYDIHSHFRDSSPSGLVPVLLDGWKEEWRNASSVRQQQPKHVVWCRGGCGLAITERTEEYEFSLGSGKVRNATGRFYIFWFSRILQLGWW